MIHAGMIAAIISLAACLVLVSRSSALRALGPRMQVAFLAVWVVIIGGLVVIIQLTGFGVKP